MSKGQGVRERMRVEPADYLKDMMQGLALVENQDATRRELELCNQRTAAFGLRLSVEDMALIHQSRNDALRDTGRVEFGRSILPELVSAFASSPYLSEDNYPETIAGLQEVFYRLKGECDERIADNDLIDALRTAFDDRAQGCMDYWEELSASEILDLATKAGQDAYEDWSESDAYSETENDFEMEGWGRDDELERVMRGEDGDRPGNRYAATFYDGYREQYRITADKEGRIGGSSLG
jgi:hypothetical protein